MMKLRIEHEKIQEITILSYSALASGLFETTGFLNRTDDGINDPDGRKIDQSLQVPCNIFRIKSAMNAFVKEFVGIFLGHFNGITKQIQEAKDDCMND